MARFDYHGDENSYRLDCQADLLRHLNSRFVVPLIPRAEAPLPLTRLNPVFSIDGIEYVMVTQFAAAIPMRDLGPLRGSLADHDRLIMAALDMLLTGF